MKKGNIIIITGPTASGKSALAIELARRLDTEIISADSRQIFKGIPIVTAVPAKEEMMGVKHHLLECLELEDYYSASLFENDALGIINDILQKKENVVVCGGSMMYIDALCNGIDELPTVPDEIRNNLMQEWNIKGNDWLLESLHSLDPVCYGRIDKNNLKRVFHAVEISITAGVPYSSMLGLKTVERPFHIIKTELNGSREKLFDRINRRVDKMVESGLEEEAARVYDKRRLNSLNTVGLKEMFAYFDGKMEKNVAIERIKKNTRVYAKKQMTWFKRDDSLKRLDFEKTYKENVGEILNILSQF